MWPADVSSRYIALTLSVCDLPCAKYSINGLVAPEQEGAISILSQPPFPLTYSIYELGAIQIQEMVSAGDTQRDGALAFIP